MRRDAMVPFDEALARAIETQQQRVRGRYPDGTVLFPRTTANPDGQRPMPTATLNLHLQNWLTDCHVTHGLDEPAHITCHQFRHTYASRLINNEVSQEVVQRLLDHTSPTMTARYARLADKTIRQQWDERRKSTFTARMSNYPTPDRFPTQRG